MPIKRTVWIANLLDMAERKKNMKKRITWITEYPILEKYKLMRERFARNTPSGRAEVNTMPLLGPNRHGRKAINSPV